MSLRLDKNDLQQGVKRSRRACLNCRRKKVKCYGELPACGFCKRLGQECRYPHVSQDHSMVEPIPANIIPKSSEFEFKFFDSRLDSLERQLTSFSTGSIASHTGHGSGATVDSLDWSLQSGNPVSFEDSPFPKEDESLTPTLVPHPLKRPRSSLPPLSSQQLAIDTYFAYGHNQAYSFFHEHNFRYQFANGLLPEYLILAVIVGTLRFSHDPYYGNQHAAAADDCAAAAWRKIMSQCFDSEDGPSYRAVQAMTLIGVHDFTCCRHGAAWVKIGIACSVAQALHMMVEPPSNLAPATREEYRRTLWSIYLLDKLATCGRYRPAIFQDHTLRLQLPSPEESFRLSIPERLPTLEGFNNSIEADMESLGSIARVMVMTSTLSRIALYVFQTPNSSEEKLPWDHNSDYTVLSAKLTWFATYFDTCDSIEDAILATCATDGIIDLHSAEPFMFSQVLYHLCHCLLQHPFLLRQKIATDGNAKFPTTFFSNAIKSNWHHAQEITKVLSYARNSGYKAAASFFGYCALIAGTINALHQYSTDVAVSAESRKGLVLNQEYLKQHARYFKNAARMEIVLEDFVHDAEQYRHLIAPTCQRLEFNEQDTERLYSIVDYGTMSTLRKFGNNGSDDGDVAATTNLQPTSPTTMDTNFMFNMMDPSWNFGVDGDMLDSGTWT